MSKYCYFVFETITRFLYIILVLNPFEDWTLKEKPHENTNYVKCDTSLW